MEALVSRSNYSNHPGKGGALSSWVPLGCPPFPIIGLPFCPGPSLSGVGPANGLRGSGVWPGSRELTDPPPHSSGRRPGAHGRGSGFLRSPLALTLPPPALPPLRGSRSSFSSTRPAPQRLWVAMEDTQLHIIEQPLPGYTDNEDPGSSPVRAQAAEEPSGAGSEELIKSDQVNGVLVLSLLDKIIGAVDQIQLTQAQLEERQAEMEGAVQSIQGELSKLGKAHATTSNTVSKLLEKVRKVSVNVKTVRGSLERQAGQIKKLEVNEAELLRRRNFKVMIYQVSWRGRPHLELSARTAVPGPRSPVRGLGWGSCPRRGNPASLARLGRHTLLWESAAEVGWGERWIPEARRGARSAPEPEPSGVRHVVGPSEGAGLGRHCTSETAPNLTLSKVFFLGGRFGESQGSLAAVRDSCKRTLAARPGFGASSPARPI